jgi:FkbM family methyltransferase
MTAPVDPAPYGTHLPDPYVRATMALTRRLPANWLGLRASMPLRRLAINRLAEKPVDTTVWNARVRLYPAHSICEKTVLFTPQLFDAGERKALADAIDRNLAAGRDFTFVDIGANVGLYSLFVAGRAGARARALAIEPQPGIVERLRFNLDANPGLNVIVAAVAVADREGKSEFFLHARDSGGARLHLGARTVDDAEAIRVACRPLAAILAQAGVSTIDALKIDIEGAEHLALAPILRDAPTDRLPRLLLIENRPASWPIDLFALIAQRGYVAAARSRHNIVFRLA